MMHALRRVSTCLRLPKETAHIFAFGTWDTSNVKFEVMSGSAATAGLRERFHFRLSNTPARRTREYHPVSWPSAPGSFVSPMALLACWTVFGTGSISNSQQHTLRKPGHPGRRSLSRKTRAGTDRPRQSLRSEYPRVLAEGLCSF